MPTYQLRSGLTGNVQEHGVSIATRSTVETTRILTEAILTFSDSSGYLIGETVTETTSTTTGIVLWNDTVHDKIGLIACSGLFVGAKTITGGTSATAKVPTAYSNILEKTAETPRWQPRLHSTDVASTGVGNNQTHYLDANTTWVRILAPIGVTVAVYGYSTSYPITTVQPGKTVTLHVQHSLNPLVLAFSASGTATVEEFDGFPTEIFVDVAEAGGGNGESAAYDSVNGLTKTQDQSPVWERRTDVSTVLGTNQDLTTSWVDVGAEIGCAGFARIALWVTLDINDSTDARVRVLAKHTSAGAEEYALPIKTVSASDVTVEPEYLEFNVDVDQLVVLEIETNNVIPYLQLQCQAGAVGATAGQLDAVYVTKGY